MGSSVSPSQEDINNFVGAAHGDFDTVHSMLSANPDLLNCNATWQETAIQAAAQTGQVIIAEYLLAAGAPLDICTAAMLGLRERVVELLEKDPNLSAARGAHGIPVLYFPIIRGNQEIAEMLLEAGADPDSGEGGTTPLHGAVLFNQASMVTWLLEHGVNPETKNYEGKTPLELARESGNTDLMRSFESAQNQE